MGKPTEEDVPRFKLVTYIGGRLHDMRTGLSWPQVCGIIGNSAATVEGESGIDSATVYREGETKFPILKFDAAGFSK